MNTPQSDAANLATAIESPSSQSQPSVMENPRSTETAEFLGILHSAGNTFEIRAINCPVKAGASFTATASGYFSDATQAASAIAAIEMCEPPGVYVTLNPVRPELSARANNRVNGRAKSTTSDAEIVRRDWLLLDLDVKRPTGISSTDAEMEAALALGRSIRDALSHEGWPMPLFGMSGNGCYLLFRIALPNDGETTDLLKRVLQGFAERFNTQAVEIDCKTFNAGRIAKVLGTMVRKGDDLCGVAGMEDRPHRQSWFERPTAQLEIVSHDLLTNVAVVEKLKPKTANVDTPKPVTSADNGANDWHDASRVARCKSYIAKMPDAVSGSGGHSATFAAACMCCRFGLGDADALGVMHWFNETKTAGEPWNERELEHKLSDAQRTVQEAGDFGCKVRNDKPKGESELTLPKPVSLARLVSDHPRLSEPIIGGLLRRGETMNIIADPKRGKSWLAYGLALSVCKGDKWLATFPCAAGRVLLIDNELQEATLAGRIPIVRDVIGIGEDQCAGRFDVLTLRGRLMDLCGIAKALEAIDSGTYDLAILDAFYRALPAGVSENDNAAMAMLFNRIDQLAARLNCGWVNIHHASKGNQSLKSVTDVGAGGGAQSRAADAHLILREHEQPGCVTLESVVRSFPPVSPMTLRWSYPTWQVADGLDPKAIKGRGTKKEEKQAERDREGREQIINALRDSDWRTVREIRGKTGIGDDRCNRLLDQLEAQGTVNWQPARKRGNDCREYRLSA